MRDTLFRAALAEFIGTFTLVFIGGAAVAGNPSGTGALVPALAHGLILVGLIYAYGHICQTHINPAVTAGLLVGGKISVARAIAYWIAQFAGAIVAAFVLAAVTGGNAGATTGSLTVSALGSAAVIEFIVTFFLVSVIYQTAVYGKGGDFAALAIGFTLVACIVAVGPLTGASLNPARTLGPALVAGDLSYVPVYFVGMFGGAITAGLLHSFVLGPIKD